MENKTIITKEFNGVKVCFKLIDGESFVRVNEVAKFCGWTKTSKGKEYIRWERVNEPLKILGCPTVDNGDYIPERTMYMLIAKANNPQSIKFMSWVADILVQLRKTGVVILDNATEEDINFEKKYGIYRIRKTFTNSKNLRADWEEFKKLSSEEWKAKRISGKERIKLQNIIFDTIKNRLADNMSNMRGSELLAIQELLTDIQTDTKKLSNKTNGGDKASLTKQIKKLQDELEELPTLKQELELAKMNIDINNYEVVDIHGMSCNYLFKYDSMFGAIKTSTYRKWINDFTRLFEENQLATKSDWEFYYDIDFTKPICIYIKYVAKAEFDIENFNKATIDMLFNRLFGVDDNIVHKVVSERLAVCDTYADGKIMYYIENI